MGSGASQGPPATADAVAQPPQQHTASSPLALKLQPDGQIPEQVFQHADLNGMIQQSSAKSTQPAAQASEDDYILLSRAFEKASQATQDDSNLSPPTSADSVPRFESAVNAVPFYVDTARNGDPYATRPLHAADESAGAKENAVAQTTNSSGRSADHQSKVNSVSPATGLPPKTPEFGDNAERIATPSRSLTSDRSQDVALPYGSDLSSRSHSPSWQRNISDESALGNIRDHARASSAQSVMDAFLFTLAEAATASAPSDASQSLEEPAIQEVPLTQGGELPQQDKQEKPATEPVGLSDPEEDTWSVTPEHGDIRGGDTGAGVYSLPQEPAIQEVPLTQGGELPQQEKPATEPVGLSDPEADFYQSAARLDSDWSALGQRFVQVEQRLDKAAGVSVSAGLAEMRNAASEVLLTSHRRKKLYYTTELSIMELLQTGDVVLVKADWLVKMSEKGEVIPKRQGLPREALWHTVEKPWEATVVALSHCWMTKTHPDPMSEQLRNFTGPMLQRFMAHLRSKYEHTRDPQLQKKMQVAVFYDWCSLPQEPRTGEEEGRYRRAVCDIGLWYAHSDVAVWMLTSMPAEEEGRVYERRAWTFYEQALCCNLKRAGTTLDLGRLGSSWKFKMDAGRPRNICKWDQGTNWAYQAIAEKCAVTWAAPLIPELFVETLATKDCGKDKDKVALAKAYTANFLDITSLIEVLSWGWLEWGDAQLTYATGAMIPYCTSLQILELNDNSISDLTILSKAICSCTALEALALNGNLITNVSPLACMIDLSVSLRTLGLSRNKIVDLSAFASPLATNLSLQLLELNNNQICDTSALASALAANVALTTLDLDSNFIVDVEPLSDALTRNTTLQTLSLSSNRILYDTPLAKLGSNSALRFLDLSSNQIAEVSGLAVALKTNCGLQDIDLSDNAIKTVEELIQTLPSNSTLESLRITGNYVMEPLCFAWRATGRNPYSLVM